LYKEKQRRALLSIVRITRTPPPDPPTRTERSVRRNETREAQERERDALAALAAFEIENSTTRTGRFEQVMSPTSQPELNYKKECPDRNKLRMAVQRANLAISLIADTEEGCSQVCHDMIIDSSCTRHMTNREDLENFRVLQDPERIMIADGSFIMAMDMGTTR
jgi:hypothetical protein